MGMEVTCPIFRQTRIIPTPVCLSGLSPLLRFRAPQRLGQAATSEDTTTEEEA